ncbi:MAG TPA: membrane-bound lytic murein transglycosylase MltF [Casimicrobiaceae bacterium]
MSKRRSPYCWVVTAALMAACGPAPTPPAPKGGDLVALLRPGPSTWYLAPDGRNAGFDYDLLSLFAQRQGLMLKVVASSDPRARLAVGDSGAALGAGALYRYPSPADDPAAALVFSAPYYTVEPVLIYNIESYRPMSWADLAGTSVAVLQGAGIARALERVRIEHPEVEWESIALSSVESLITQVSDGTLDYAVVAANEADVAQSTYLNVERAFSMGGRLDLVWAFAPAQSALRDQADAFFTQIRKDGTLTRLIERYFARVQVPRIDAGVFHERMKTVLPQYRPLFEHAQETTGVEWRLLAAIAYQESQWDAQATSETGVRGLMQLTEETARRLGVSDRLDPHESALGAARYLRDLKDKLPSRIAEPDRTWIALAAYNIGVAHLEDARILAQKQKQSPDSWTAVRKTLPLLALPEYYEDTKYGFARGGMPVAFVDRVRAYYDMLLANQPDSRPRLRMFSSSGEVPSLRADVPALGGK